MSQRPIGRILAVTALLAALGGIAGGLGGLLIVAAVALLGRSGTGDLLFALEIGSMIGFAFGLLAGPTLAWAMLRRAPIWRAIGETALAAGMASTLAMVMSWNLIQSVCWAGAASLAAAFRLRHAYRVPREAGITSGPAASASRLCPAALAAGVPPRRVAP